MSTPEDTSPVPEFPTQADLDRFVASLGLPPDAPLTQVHSALEERLQAGLVPPGYRAPEPETPKEGTSSTPSLESTPDPAPTSPGTSPVTTPTATIAAAEPEPDPVVPPFQQPSGTAVGTVTIDGHFYIVVVP